jgi:hypothetical protein
LGTPELSFFLRVEMTSLFDVPGIGDEMTFLVLDDEGAVPWR